MILRAAFKTSRGPLLWLTLFKSFLMYKLHIQSLALAYLPSTALLSSSLSSSPRFLIAPAFGASSRRFAASAFRYACCNVRTLVAYNASNLVSNWLRGIFGRIGEGERMLQATDFFLVVQALIVILQHWRTFPLS